MNDQNNQQNGTSVLFSRARDFRHRAWSALSAGKWGVAILALLLAWVLGVYASPNFKVDYTIKYDDSVFEQYEDDEKMQDVIEDFRERIEDANTWLTVAAPYFIGFAAFLFLYGMTVGAVTNVGYCKFNLNVMGDGTPEVKNLVAYFKNFNNIVIANLLRAVFTFLWFLALIVPGIVAMFSYAMVPYILADNPEMNPTEAIRRSKEMMRGNKIRLFCLRLSFIGWFILAALCTCGILNLMIMPYYNAADAEFYNEISARKLTSQTTDI